MTQDNGQSPDAATKEPKRVSTLSALGESWAYLRKAMKDESIQIRDTDKLTAKLLRLSILVAAGCVIVPFFKLKELAFVFYGVADLLFLGSVLVFVISRFGILRVMSPRHALVCWHLMLGTSLLAVALALNILFLIVYSIAGRYLAIGGS